MAALQEVVNRFPDSAYARDAQLKIDLCRDHLAGKEMEIGRWYERQHLYTAAIGRFQRVVDDYQTTNHVAEALHRLTEIYLLLGLPDEARRTAAVLGYNYPGQQLVRRTATTQLAADGRAVKGAKVPAVMPARPGLLQPRLSASDRSDGRRAWHAAHADRARDPRRGADRAAGPRLRRRPDRADRRDRGGQVDPARQPRASRSARAPRRGWCAPARAGQRRRGVFAAPPSIPRCALLAEQGIGAEDELVLRRVLGARRPLARLRQRRSRSASRCCAGSARCWSRCRASTTRWAWPIPPATPACSTPSAWPPELRAAVAARPGAPGAPPSPRSRPRAGSDRRRPSATRTGCATRSTNWPTLAPERRRGGAARRRAAARCSRASGAPRRSPRRWPNSPPRDRARQRPGRRAARRRPGAAAAAPTGRRRGPAAPAARGAGARRGSAGRGRNAARRGCADEAEADPRAARTAEERLFALRAAARKHGVRGRRAARPAGLAARPAGRAGDRRGAASPRSSAPPSRAAPPIADGAAGAVRGAARRRPGRLDRRWPGELPPLQAGTRALRHRRLAAARRPTGAPAAPTRCAS